MGEDSSQKRRKLRSVDTDLDHATILSPVA